MNVPCQHLDFVVSPDLDGELPSQVNPRELSSCRGNGSFSFPQTFPRPQELALRLALRGEGKGLENR